ncbi:hypothetical protein T06_6792, partial [Trichinella sp. T6]
YSLQNCIEQKSDLPPVAHIIIPNKSLRSKTNTTQNTEHPRLQKQTDTKEIQKTTPPPPPNPTKTTNKSNIPRPTHKSTIKVEIKKKENGEQSNQQIPKQQMKGKTARQTPTKETPAQKASTKKDRSNQNQLPIPEKGTPSGPISPSHNAMPGLPIPKQDGSKHSPSDALKIPSKDIPGSDSSTPKPSSVPAVPIQKGDGGHSPSNQLPIPGK